MTRKLLNDASSAIQGTIYQFYIALLKCFEMKTGEKVFIERYGDITVSNSQQLEVKHYESDLTDNHTNFWKTLYNWMQTDFDEGLYSTLILFTTQEIGQNSLLNGWNASETSGRIDILNKIHKTSLERQKTNSNAADKPESLRLQEYVLNPDRLRKCGDVVSKFTIASGSPGMEDVFLQMRDIHAKHILSSKCNDYLIALLGFVISPKIVQGNGWEITYEGFSGKVQELTSQYCRGTTQFPVKHQKHDPVKLSEEVNSRRDQAFVTKIREIEYHEVIQDAISDYLYACQTVLKEFKDYEVPTTRYDAYCKDLLDHLEPKLRMARRNVTDTIRDSQNFYDDVTMESSPSFPGFETPPLSFKNGVIHIHFDDPSKDLKWRLD